MTNAKALCRRSWFFYSPEVTVCAIQASASLPTSGLPRADPGGLVRSAPALPNGSAPEIGRVPSLVLPADLDEEAPAGAAPAGAVVRGMPETGQARPGDGGGPHPTAPRGLGAVLRSRKSAIALHVLPQPQNTAGIRGKMSGISAGSYVPAPACAAAHIRACACARSQPLRGCPPPGFGKFST